MGLEEELLRIAKKLEKMVSRKKTVRLQSLQRSPRATEARLPQLWAWWACRPCAGRERAGQGTRDWGGVARQGVPRLLAGHFRMGMCMARSGGDRTESPKARDCCKSLWTGWVRSWAACAEQRKSKERHKPRGGHLGVWGFGMCARPGELQAQRELEGHVLGDFKKDRRTSG